MPCGKSCAASTADSQVPDSAEDRCTDTTWDAPESRTCWNRSANSAGVGREVETATFERSARATSAEETSMPSVAVRFPNITRSGTTSTPSSSSLTRGKQAVESVTTRTDIGASDHEVHETAGHGDDPPRVAAVQRGRHLLVGPRRGFHRGHV